MNRVDTSQPWELTTTQQERLRRDITPNGVIERAAQAVSIQRTAEDIVGAIRRYNQSTEGKLAMEREHRRQVAAQKTVYGASSGLITRGQQPALATMHAQLEGMQRRGAQLQRQVQRERAGYR